jgi:hypothetical protein
LSFLAWLEALPVSEWVAQSDWGYPIMLSIHSIGMAAVVGLLLMLDFRVLGYATRIPLAAFHRFMPFAWAGFVLNLISGLLLFASTASRLVENWPFVLKMIAILCGGIASWLLWRELDASDGVTVTRKARTLGFVSLVVWLLAIIFGRLIAYVMDHSILNGG